MTVPHEDTRRFEWSWIVIGLCVAITVYIAIIPLGFLIWQSFFTPQTAEKAAKFTLGNYVEAYGSSETARRQYMARALGTPYALTAAEVDRIGMNLRKPHLLRKVWDYHRGKL